jgi:hypothetical protein
MNHGFRVQNNHHSISLVQGQRPTAACGGLSWVLGSIAEPADFAGRRGMIMQIALLALSIWDIRIFFGLFPGLPLIFRAFPRAILYWLVLSLLLFTL